MPMSELEQTIIGLSSGTIAGLIGNSLHVAIDDARADFLAFVRLRYRRGRQPWPTWIDAWQEFDNYRNNVAKK